MAESWALDGVSLTSGDFDILELNVDPPRARQEWASAADSEWAALQRQPLHENRTITMKLRVTPQASMNAALDKVGAIRDKCRKASTTQDGVALTWTPSNSSRQVTFDVLAGDITELPVSLDGLGFSWLKQRPVLTLELTCKPYWRGTETVLTAVNSAAAPVTTTTISNVPGDVPALGRLLVTDTSATLPLRFIEWGMEHENYNAATSLILDSDSFVTTGFAGTQGGITGSYDPGAAGSNEVGAFGLSTPQALFGTGNQSHVGSFRVKARAFHSASFAYQTMFARWVWRVGDGQYVANDWVQTVSYNEYTMMDLGTMTVPAAVAGSQRWDGRVEFYSTTGGVSLHVDFLLFMPIDAGYGKSTADLAAATPSATVAWDDYASTTAGVALNARVATSGGTWATSGAATDFVFADVAGGETASRTAAGVRYAVLGTTNYTDIGVGSVVNWTANFNGNAMGVLARYIDANNFYVGRIEYQDTAYQGSNWILTIWRVVTGVGTLLTRAAVPLDVRLGWYTVWLLVYSSGTIIARITDAANLTTYVEVAVTDATAATGGALAGGKVGLQDVGASGVTHYYDNFQALSLGAEPVVAFPLRWLEVRHDTTFRVSADGAAVGKPPSYKGTRFLVQPAGADNKTTRVAVIANRANIERYGYAEWTPGNAANTFTVQVAYTPRGLVVPR